MLLLVISRDSSEYWWVNLLCFILVDNLAYVSKLYSILSHIVDCDLDLSITLVTISQLKDGFRASMMSDLCLEFGGMWFARMRRLRIASDSLRILVMSHRYLQFISKHTWSCGHCGFWRSSNVPWLLRKWMSISSPETHSASLQPCSQGNCLKHVRNTGTINRPPFRDFRYWFGNKDRRLRTKCPLHPPEI